MAAEDPDIGLWIKRARERERWTQRDLAARIGVDRKTIDNWENGRSYPRSSIGALEAILGKRGGEPPIIPPRLQRMIDDLSPEEREWVLERLTVRREAEAADHPPAARLRERRAT